MKFASIKSTGSYVPERVVSNAELESLVKNYDPRLGKGTLDEWYRKHYGIKERRWAAQDEMPSDMAAKAARQAMQRAGVKPDEIDFIILNTAFGDYQQPTTATIVQRALGITNAFAIEINMPCAGPVYGLALSQNFITSGKYHCGLVVGADRMSSFIDMEDYVMAGLFGDGAGACVVVSSDKSGIQDYHLKSRGEEGGEEEYLLRVLAGKAKYPGYDRNRHRLDFLLQMEKHGVNAFFESSFEDVINTLLPERNHVKPDWIIPHQASLNLVLNAISRQGIAEEKALFTIAEYGNTSSASILITLDKYFQEHYKRGDRLLLIGTGGGLNWGGLLLKT